jgi:hypothetical protein
MGPEGRGVGRRGLVLSALIVASIVVVVSLVRGAVVVVRVLYTPTAYVPVVNDTTGEVTLSGCASDIDSLPPGQRVLLDPVAGDPHAACLVYSAGNQTSTPDHCLDLPTSHITPTVLVHVSSARPYSEHPRCGD